MSHQYQLVCLLAWLTISNSMWAFNYISNVNVNKNYKPSPSPGVIMETEWVREKFHKRFNLNQNKENGKMIKTPEKSMKKRKLTVKERKIVWCDVRWCNSYRHRHAQEKIRNNKKAQNWNHNDAERVWKWFLPLVELPWLKMIGLAVWLARELRLAMIVVQTDWNLNEYEKKERNANVTNTIVNVLLLLLFLKRKEKPFRSK